MIERETMKTDDLSNVSADNFDGKKLRKWLILPVKTNDMLPIAQTGDEIIINTQEEFNDGDIVLCWDNNNNKPILRRLYILNDEAVLFISDNKADDPIICTTEKELYLYTYIGKLVSVGRVIK